MAVDGLQKTRLTAGLRVERFRGVEEAELKLAPITIVTGRNNSGKSSLLEALAIAASAPAGLRDWLGADVVRNIIDGKLLGHPQRLLHGGAAEASIELEYTGTPIRLRLRRLHSVEPEARRLACTAMDMVGEITLRFCIGVAAESTAEAALSDGTGRVYKLLSSALNSAKVLCRSRRVGAGGGLEETAAAAILDALANAASIIVENSIEIVYMLASDYSGVSRAIYYPGADGLKHVSKRIRVVLNESIREITGKLVEASNVEVNLDELTRCLAAAFRDALDRVVRGSSRGMEAQPVHGVGPRVFTLFHRNLLGRRRSLVRAVTDAVKGLLSLGLLDVYRDMLRSVPGLGFEDLLVAGGEVLLKTRDKVVPASVLGDGALHLLLLTAGLALARGGDAVVVFEEPETGLHPGYMDVFARLLVDSVAEAANNHVVVAMSTHSLELIRYVTAAAREKSMLDSLATVLMHEGSVFSVFEGEEAAEASELDIDLRGV